MSKKLLVSLLFITAGCASPRWMMYQRSEYSLNKYGDLMVSSSPDFHAGEFRRSGDAIELAANFILQNTGAGPLELSLAEAHALIIEKPQKVFCKDQTGEGQKITIASGKKATVTCVLVLVALQQPKGDAWVNFKIPYGKEEILAKKILRYEDFQ